ncbi:exocyst complex component Sec5p [Trichomonascus vanleenenianus]|uniref:exocyst subunit SEC5 n=1 Tax=Trichomonascus vanleenenianus TaxID=2268995 RepID=UPI003ECAF467
MDKEQVLQHYNISDEFATHWVEPKEFEELNLNQNGELSKYAVLRQLVGTSSSSGETAVQDEADPLGSTNSVVSVLEARGIDVEDPAVRGQYLISSSKFNPKVFLRDVHRDAGYNDLVNTLGYLEASIAERSETLRFLVERDYDRFVKSKSLLDSVLEEIKGTGFTPEKQWGMQQVLGSIDEANSKLSVVMKPILEDQTRETRLKSALELIKNNRYLFNLPSTILKHIKNQDHDSLIRDYRRGRDMKSDEEIYPEMPENEIQNKKVTDRIWREVESIVDDYKQEQWKLLAKSDVESNYMAIISKLLELGVEDNPIVEWISTQSSNYIQLAEDKFSKLKLRTKLMKMNLLALPPSANASFTLPLKAKLHDSSDESTLSDSPDVVEMWLTVKRFIDDISASVEKACMFWAQAGEFLNGSRQRNLPTGYQEESRVHLVLSESEINEIRDSGRQMVELFRTNILEFFGARTSGSPSPNGNNNHLSTNVEDFLFLPPYSNAFSAVKYLSHALVTLSRSFSVLSQANVTTRATEDLRNVLTKVREQCLKAVRSTWESDCKKFAMLEDWTVSQHNKSCTYIPQYFKLYQLAVLSGIRNIVYFASSDGEQGSQLLVAQPSTRLLNGILNNFRDSCFNILESLIKLLSTLGDTKRMSYLDKTANQTDELTPSDMNNDSKVLLLLSNLSEVRESVLPFLYRYIENSFGTPYRDVKRALDEKMDSMDGELFELYTKRKRINLADIIRSGVHESNTNWQSKIHPTTISPYVQECLLMLVIVHAKVSEVSPRLVDRVLVVLFEHVTKTMLTSLREIERFEEGGMLQAVADIEFLVAVMSHYMNVEVRKNVELIYGTLKKSSQSSAWKTKEGPKAHVINVIRDTYEKSKMEFSCFQPS